MTFQSIHFMDNNLIPGVSLRTVSSELTANPFSNSQDQQRSRTWKPTGRFVITADNQELYIDDGSSKTVSLTIAEYATPALLAAHIQTQLNASSSSWSCVYSTTTFKFMIVRSAGTAELITSNRTNAIWDDIGFTILTDMTTSPHEAQAQRNHTSESVIIDLGVETEVTFLGIIGPLADVFSIQTTATVTLAGNNVNAWTSPPFDETAVVTERGVMHFLDFDINKIYRYWKLEIIDKTNPAGPEGIEIGYLYIGGSTTLASTNVARGFSKGLVDPTVKVTSESGATYFDIRTPYENYNNLEIQNMSQDDRVALEKIFREFSTFTPLFVSIDPSQSVSATADDLTMYAYFNGQPSIGHLFTTYFTANISMREAG